MNLFFYSLTDSAQRSRLLSKFELILPQHPITDLGVGRGVVSPLSCTIRSGDVIIVYVAELYELEILVGAREKLESFRKILLLESEELDRYWFSLCRQLYPRYIAHGYCAVEETAIVASKMMKNCQPYMATPVQYAHDQAEGEQKG
ncbi:hypothetical protein [Desulfogranum marinum]|uniref:hypothetical protein n=1 Tax=Desulfogranum marinum TaxID=453220 RepID=UPI0019643565|nr:hypothetical protein [Desulfogranum marinum]MBM9511117.1 hypothetical protein [Desulfogranum marinum]